MRFSERSHLLLVCLDQIHLIQDSVNALQTTYPESKLTLWIHSHENYKDDVHHINQIWRDLCHWQEAEQTFNLVQRIKSHGFDAVIIFTAVHQSPYPIAYLCYLAEIPVRIGQSQEFGGGLLSQCIHPLSSDQSLDPHLHLLKATGLIPESFPSKSSMSSLRPIFCLP